MEPETPGKDEEGVRREREGEEPGCDGEFCQCRAAQNYRIFRTYLNVV